MKLKNTLALAGAMAVVAAPVAVNAESFDRAVAPVDSESELAGGALIGALAVAAIVAGIIIVADDDDDEGVSP
ncbi:hypothetical protein [Alteriqipengyuania lutimaris]|uniref:Ferrochelatase n=1 Tax=Alteriqipengyuania lutimaris TaxID=1538146 RepID=A0A395LRC0_9SPHN|nr:hypothetical protein [Alteriqipengyuania lutimaris]MBB3032830.1 hypothetical protein [Alteriqipengyuania lutimaris]RDS78074.1 hypothetical protein DL238_11000 [Alteriqipengyuania lutimaris]